MRKITLITTFLLSIISIYCYGQENYIVTADNGLVLRKKPNSTGEKIGKLYFGTEITILEKTENFQTINDNGTMIKGNWVKIKFDNFPRFISNDDYGYIFDGYLKKKTEITRNITAEISEYAELDNYSINENILPFYLKGDFFGDGIPDLVILVKNSKGSTKIAIINKKKNNKNKVHILGNKNDPFNMTDYSWIGIFEKVKRRTVLYSNYEDDFIDYKDVPENKKVRLSYDALYMHASESCGGGFVFWKDGKFNWLQQE